MTSQAPTTNQKLLQWVEGIAALTQPEKNLAVFDAFRGYLDRHYFDPKALEATRLQTALDEYRTKAASAKDGLALYSDVIWQLQQQFPHSHVTALPPKSSATQTSENKHRNALMLSGPGFDSIGLRREKPGVMFIVGEVEPGSLAARAGIAPGWIVS